MDPPYMEPYFILVWAARSPADSMGDTILSTVRKAARLAVYEEIIMRVKNHQTLATSLVEAALGGGKKDIGYTEMENGSREACWDRYTQAAIESCFDVKITY